jgi:putative ABC transport system permease protein
MRREEDEGRREFSEYCAARRELMRWQRRAEAGIRRALGATRARSAFSSSPRRCCFSPLGGIGGTLLGVGITGLYAYSPRWPTVVAAWTLGATMLVGAVAGLQPAIRASRVPPTTALTGRTR